MPNKWIAHIKKTMRKMKDSGTYVAGKGLKQVIAVAKKSWHSVKKGVGLKGGAEDSHNEKESSDGKMMDVNMMGDAAAKAAREKSNASSTGMEKDDPNSLAGVMGGRKRKTRRRRRHSRRR